VTDSDLITGCSTGFGLETALQLAGSGFRVYATVRDLSCRPDVEKAAAERGVELRMLRLDVTDSDSIREAIDTVVEESGGIYAVVNNAGLLIRGYFEDLDEAEIRQVLETNLFGTMAVTRAALPHMRRAGRGRVVVLTSVAGKVGAPTGCAYSASRFAQEGFAESLYQELLPLGIRVVLLEPGIARTQRWKIDRGAARRARDPESPYKAWFERAEQLFDEAMDASPITGADVARTVTQALTARRPRIRYVVGRRAGLIIALRRYLPGQWFDRLYFDEVIRRVTKT
jgi:NAD(P)-dependent dehydrogenase (short-subunit alcohol dehydrogenase family)